MAAERGRSQNECRVYQVVAGEVLQPLPKEFRFGFVDDALWAKEARKLPIRGECDNALSC